MAVRTYVVNLTLLTPVSIIIGDPITRVRMQNRGKSQMLLHNVH